MKNKKSNYTCHSLEEYNLAMNLRSNFGWGEYRIQRKLLEQGFNVKLGAIIGWIRYGKKPFNQRIVSQIPESSKHLTKEKSYVLGTLCGDGYLATGYRIGLDVCDKEFAQYFRYCLWKIYNLNPSIRLVTEKKTNFKSQKPQYCVMLVSKLAALDLLSYIPSFKTFEWGVPEQVKEASLEIKAMFIKGFADSEGSVKNRSLNREIYLFSGNSKGLKEVQQLLTHFSINSFFSKRGATVFSLRTGDYRSLKNYYDNVGFIIKRKQEKLEAGLKRYKRKGIRKYSLGIKKLAVDMLSNGYNYQDVGTVLNTSYANIHDWKKATENPNYYKDRWKKSKLK
jgi:intein-encoded DNA endonuclease-like protein